MATYESTQPAPFGAVATHRIISAIDSAIETFNDWSSRRATRDSLSRLSDRQLADIGLSRADIDRL